jgi:DNA primase
MFDRATIREVRQRTDLVDLVNEFVPLKRKGGRHFGRCPFHQEKTASFSVSGDVGLYFCFGCKATGDALRFFQETQGVNFPEAVRALARRAGVEVPEDRTPEEIAEDRRQRDLTGRLLAVCEVAAKFFERQLAEGEWSELARAALDERGIAPETVERFRLGYAPASWDALAAHLRAHQLSPHDATLAGLLVDGRRDRFRHRLMFPILDAGGRVVAFSGRILPTSAGMEGLDEGLVPEDAGKYVNSPETPLYRKGELLYGLTAARQSIRQRERALLVEGNFDVVQMHQHGFTETVAPLGTSFTDAQAKLLRRHTDRVTFLFDGDGAGRRAARAAHGVAERGGVLLLVVRCVPLRPRFNRAECVQCFSSKAQGALVCGHTNEGKFQQFPRPDIIAAKFIRCHLDRPEANRGRPHPTAIPQQAHDVLWVLVVSGGTQFKVSHNTGFCNFQVRSATDHVGRRHVAMPPHDNRVLEVVV